MTDQVSASAVMLPTYTQLSLTDQTRVVETIALAQKQLRKASTSARRAA